MCGIAGLFDVRATMPEARLREAVLRAMTDSIVHRGPDAEGQWHDADGRCSLGHRRLSIIDTSDAGRQPMANAGGRWVTVFNGEIYNFKELRPQLEAAGLPFGGRTDTEVLLQALALWGTDALARLDGMFAFAAFDRESGQLILARDPFGEKPLYYAELPGGGLAFASELQALEKVPGVDFDVSVDAMAELLMFQYIGAPRTIYRGVKKLPPGHWLIAWPGQPLRTGRYFAFRPGSTGFDERPLGQLADELEDILVRGLRRRLISDVPLGAFLSGGVDSSTVCALIRRRLGVPLQTFSIGFQGAPESEHETAQAFARHLQTEHRDQIVTPDASAFLLGIGRVLDEPNADSSCLPTYLLSKFARETVTVALSGDGGDEMFGGYGRYFHTLDDANRNASRESTGWHAGQAYYSNRILVSVEEHARELFGEVPAGTGEHIRALREQLTDPSLPLACLLRTTDVDNYMPGAVLPKVDRMAMQHSLEVRTPFLSTELARFAERLPPRMLYDGRRGKLVLREIAYRYLPRELIDLPKQGFGLPVSRWGTDELLRVAGDLLESEDSRLRSALGPDAIGRFMARQRTPGNYSTYQVWSLAMLESWLRHHPAKTDGVRAQLEAAVAAATAAAAAAKAEGAAPAVDAAPGRSWVADRLYLWPVARRIFVLVEDGTLRLDDGAAPSDSALRVRDDVQRMALAEPELAPELLQAPDRTEPLQLPGWSGLGDARLGADVRRALDGATLLLPLINLSDRAGWRPLDVLRRAGVRRIVAPHPYRGDGALFSLRMRHVDGIQGLLEGRRLSRLRSRSAGTLSPQRVRGHLSVAGPVAAIPSDAAEMSDRFMIFEGGRQLPPLPASHALIEEEGGGRYSVWSCHVYLSRARSGWTGAHWFVPRSPETEPLLQFVPTTIDSSDRSPEGFFQAMGEFAARAAPAGAIAGQLSPGDRIVLLTHALPPGGAERQWVYLARELKQRGYDVRFVVLNAPEGDNGHYLPLLRDASIPVSVVGRMPLPEMLANLPQDPESRRLCTWPGHPLGPQLVELACLLRRERPRAVYAQLDFPNLVAGCASLMAGVPAVAVSFRNFNPSNFPYLNNDWFQPLYQALARSRSVYFTGNSKPANDDYARWIGIPPERVHWVPNALESADLDVPAAERRAALRAELGIAEGAPVLLGVFRMSEEKRPLWFVDVCAALSKRVPGLRVLVAGIGPMAAMVKDRVEEAGLSSSVSLLGRRDDVAALMSIADALLLTSSFEGMPNVVMEAQVLGLPAVVSKVGGAPDCLLDGDSGHLVDAEDFAGFVERTERLLTDREAAHRMRDCARAWAASQFSHRRMADRFLGCLQPAADAVEREAVVA